MQKVCRLGLFPLSEVLTILVTLITTGSMEVDY